MALREAEWTDAEGRKWVTLLPDSEPANQAYRGIPFGPPSLEALMLPHDIEIRLHNELVARRLLRAQDLIGRQSELVSAVMSACRLDAQTLEALYPRP